jgi:hypothetical protein
MRQRADIKRRLGRLILILAACAALAAGPVREARADHERNLDQLPPQLREYLIKAAFVYNFARFTEWPAAAFQGPTSPLRLCLLGKDPFGQALDSIAGKKIKNRDIEVRHLLFVEEARACHVLFISESAKGRLAEVLQLLRDAPILTIGDMPDAARAGGIIGLEIVQKKVRFRVNLDNAQGAGLKMSSRLLDLAMIVRNEPDAGDRPSQAEAAPTR